MNEFAKSILNYFAAFTETKFRFQSKGVYKWTNDYLTCDFLIFPEFQRKILDALKTGKPLEFAIKKGEYVIELDSSDFINRLINLLKSKYNVEYLNEAINIERKEKIDNGFTSEELESIENEKKLLYDTFRTFNIAFREEVHNIFMLMQEEKKKKLNYLIKDFPMPITTFNPKYFEQIIYEKIKEFVVNSNSVEEFYKCVFDYISSSSWTLEMYDLYSMIRKFSYTQSQYNGSAYIFFHGINIKNELANDIMPIFLAEISINVDINSVTIKNESGVIFINTPAINSGSFNNILSIPRAARIVDAQDYISTIESFLQDNYNFYNPFLLEQGFNTITAYNKPNIYFRLGLQIIQKEDRKLLDYSELITRIDAGQGGKFIELVNNYVSGNVPNTTDEVNKEYSDRYGANKASSFLSTIPLNLNNRQKRVLLALENQKNNIIVIDGPPGTGKSYVILAMVYWANQNKKSVVITSHKKAAIDVIDRMMTERFKKLHPNAKPSIMRITKKNSDSINNFENTLASPVISAATNRYNEFNLDAVNKDIEKQKEIIYGQTEQYLNNSNIYETQIKNLFQFENIEQKLISESIIAENDRPIKSYNQTVDIDKLSDYIKSVPDLSSNITIDKFEYLLSIKDSIPILIETCELINKINISTKEIDDLNSIDIDVLNDYEKTIKEIEKFTKHTSKVFTDDIEIKLLHRGKKNNILKNIKDLSSLKYEFVNDNIKILSKAGLDEINLEQLIKALNKIKEIEKNRSKIDQFSDFYRNLDLSQAGMKDIYRFLLSVKEIIQNTTSVEFESIRLFSEKYSKIIEKSGFDNKSINGIKNFFRQNDSNSLLFKYVKLFETLTTVENYELPNQNRIKDYYQSIERKLENINDSRLKNLNNYIGDISRIETTLKAGKRLNKQEAEVLLNNVSCILSEPELLPQYLPMDEDLIDILIIDEASQVSIAESISLMLRAKQVVVLGDELQYGAIGAVNVNKEYSSKYFKDILDSYEKEYNTEIGEEQKNQFIDEVSKDIEEDDVEVEKVYTPEGGTKDWLKTFNIRTSTLNFAKALRNYSISLDTHFRSFPEIIDYSNEFFYKQCQIPLIVNRIRTKPIKEVLRFIKVETKGNSGNNINLDEIEAIKNDINNLIANGYKGTIGIITSFREQMQEMERILRKEMDNYFILQRDHKLAIWFVADVQGEERDTIYYSFVEDKKLGNGSLKSIYPVPGQVADDIHKFKMQRLNVGFSRAKDSMVFVHSMPLEDYSDTRLGDALKHYKNLLEQTVDNYIEDESIFGSEAEKELYALIINTEFYKRNKDNIKLIAQFPIGKYIMERYKRYIPKYRVDFLLTLSQGGKEQSLILEYDGLEYHTKNPEIVNEYNFSQEYLEYDIQRQLELESYGYRFLRINKFNLIPREEYQTKIDVLNKLLENKFK
jgi:very-short-patch-repair endonuclease